jgi:hypothetical protein
LSKFKVGDKVRRIFGLQTSSFDSHFVKDKEYTVTYAGRHTIEVSGTTIGGHSYMIEAFELVPEDTSSYHKHHDAIVVWAKGASIQYYAVSSDRWIDCDGNKPGWHKDVQYRVKPAPKFYKEVPTSYGADISVDGNDKVTKLK